MSNPLTFPVFFFFLSFLLLLLVCSCFLFFFFSSSSFLPARCIVFFFSFCSFRASPFLLLLMVCSCFYFFLLLSIPASFFVPLVDVVLWCLKLSFTVTRFVLNPWRTRDMLYSHLQHHDTIIKQTQGQRPYHISSLTLWSLLATAWHPELNWVK